MLRYSPEAAFILAMFDLVLASLPLAVLVWVGFRERVRSIGWGWLVAGFVSLSVAFVAEAVYSRVAISPTGAVNTSHAWLLILSHATRLGSSVALAAAHLLRAGHRRPLSAFFAVAIAAVGLAGLALTGGVLVRFESIEPLTPFGVADVVILTVGAALIGPANRLTAVALLALAIGRSGAMMSAIWPEHTSTAWGLGMAIHLAGLTLLALTLERESRLRLLHHVLRFNLVFVSLAACLVVVLAAIGQRQFVEFSGLQIRDVAEFARGDLIAGRRLGGTSAGVLADPRILNRLVREFGRYPDLRRIRLALEGQSMELRINEAGEIDQQFWSGEHAEAPLVAPRDFTEAVLLRDLVLVDGQAVGSVELHHSLVRINTGIGRQMAAAFGVFTLFVVIGSIATGALVLVAERTIGRQYQELSEAQRRLSRSERLASVGAVASAVAHEINNPAGVLVARSDYLLRAMRGQPFPSEVQEDVETIRRQAQRIAKTVKDLLNTTVRTQSVRDRVDVATLIESGISLVRPVFSDRTVAFECRVAHGAAHAWGDRDRLEQVFVNLLSNGAQAITGRGRVSVSAAIRPNGGWVDVDVVDTGSGIQPHDRDRIFDPFFTNKGPDAGSGLGLAIVRRIVQDHGGHISVESTVGVGTTFRVSLPTSPEAVTPATGATAASDTHV
jgi:signal transduction histidine kinase